VVGGGNIVGMEVRDRNATGEKHQQHAYQRASAAQQFRQTGRSATLAKNCESANWRPLPEHE
jgi:hypothetical protein